MSKKPYKYLAWHCSATREGKEVTRTDIEKWHTGPRNMRDGTVKYKEKIYPSRADLPDEYIGGKSIKLLKGRGWKRLGYSAIFHLNGTVEEITPYNDDAYIEDWEKTNGIAGFNSGVRHYMYVGGLDKNGKAKDTRTPEQLLAMEVFTADQIHRHPELQVLGHNEKSNKKCPSFSVPDWMVENAFPKGNIYAFQKNA